MNKAYFEGKSDILKNHLDGAKGAGTFRELTNAIEKKEYKTASKVMDKQQN